MFRKATAQTKPAEDDIPEDALASIPDLPEADASEVEADEPEDFHGMIAELRASIQASFARELDNVERSFLAGLRDVQARLRSAEAENERLAALNADLLQQRAALDRKVEGLKQLTKAIGEL